jgi:hypothetical protein
MNSVTIKTYPAYPPIPDRTQDWCAWYDGEEELQHYGWGATEAAAIKDLRDHYEPGD